MFLKIFSVVCIALAAKASVEFRIKNNDGGDVWIGIQGNDGKEALEGGGFVLGSGQQVNFESPFINDNNRAFEILLMCIMAKSFEKSKFLSKL